MPSDPTSNWRLLGSGPEGVKWATGHGDVGDQAPHGNWATGMKLWTANRIGTWNVRGLREAGKLAIIEREVAPYSIVGFSETHWTGRGHFATNNGNVIYFSGHENQSRNGVAVWINKRDRNAVKEYRAVSDRIVVVRLESKPANINIVQIYAPTSEADDMEIEAFYADLEDTLGTFPNREITIIMGDFNAKIGETTEDNDLRDVVGKYGLGIRNERGERLLNFCTDNSLFIANTGFKHHPRRLYTWRSPGERYRNQIDFILIKSRWRTTIKNVRTYPGKDCNSDHQFLAGVIRMKLRVPRRQATDPPGWHLKNNNNYKDMAKQKLESLTDHQNDSADSLWTQTKAALHSAAQQTRKTIPKQKKIWIKDSTWAKIQERKVLKAKGLRETTEKDMYRNLNKDIKRLCRKDKNQYINEVCQEIEQHQYKYETRDMFKKIKQLTRKFTPKYNGIKTEDGQLLTKDEDILGRWKTYCEQLMAREGTPEDHQLPNEMNEEQEPEILIGEVEAAMKRLKCYKSPGIDDVTAEMITATDEMGVKVIHKICQKIWNTSIWPKDWTTSLYIPLHKKGPKDVCENYRTIALLSHPSKIMLQIISERLKTYLLPEIPEEQAGFMPGRGTREQILNIRQIIEKSREYNTTAYICFIDYSKAFDCVEWERMWRFLLEMGAPMHLISLIKNLYENNIARVKINGQLSECFQVGRGVRQGCVLSPMLFNVYGECIMRRAVENWRGGISIGGRTITNLRYADDTTLFARTEEELISLLQKVEQTSLEAGLRINKSKTKIMIVDRPNNNHPEIKQINSIKTVKQFVYLGSLITNTGGCSEEIKRRIAIAKTATTNLQKIWKSHDIATETKIRLVRSLVFPVLLYGAECWTLKESDKRAVDVFEMYCWRRMLRIPWTARRTNQSIIEQLNIKKRLRTVVSERIAAFFGHIIRRDGLEKLTVQGKVEGARGRGRSPTRYTDHITRVTGLSFGQCVGAAIHREKWRKIVQRIS